MMFQSEAQFLDNYGERPIGRFNGQQSNQENTMWDKLSKIFTFGCIETSHNNKPWLTENTHPPTVCLSVVNSGGHTVIFHPLYVQ